MSRLGDIGCRTRVPHPSLLLRRVGITSGPKSLGAPFKPSFGLSGRIEPIAFCERDKSKLARTLPPTPVNGVILNERSGVKNPEHLG